MKLCGECGRKTLMAGGEGGVMRANLM